MPLLHATSIYRYDVVIIGGGIAGLAIAELLARKSSLSIKLVDSASQLGSGASGKLEGWFHAGALYSGADDAQTYVNCLNGIEDLITQYSNYFGGRCNMVLTEAHPGKFTPAVSPRDGAWFNDAPVYYMLPGPDSPEIRLSRFKSDAVYLEIQRQRVFGRLEAAFGQQHNWLQGGACRAPAYAQIEEHGSGHCSLRDTSGLLRNLCRRFDESFGVTESRYDVLRSADVTMNTATVMRDLAGSAMANGVEIETDLTIERLILDRFGPLRLKGIACRRGDGQPVHLKAKLFVFAIGDGFADHLQALNIRARLKMSRSPMMVAVPTLSAVNFARMSTKQKFHFNHHLQKGFIGETLVQYSMLANSGFSEEGEDVTQSAADFDQLLDLAERFFGTEQLYSRQLYAYECTKTEFISEESEKRRYSYWIEVSRDGNFVSVLPGKFSFFPTVAYQTSLRIKELLDFKEKPSTGGYVEERQTSQRATCLVADHYPLRILSNPVESGRLPRLKTEQR